MKIAFFHNLPSGGGKRSAYEWMKFMAKFHEVDLYSYNPKAEAFLDLRPMVRKTTLIQCGRVDGLGGMGRLKSLNNAKKASKAIAHAINTGGYDLAFVMQCEVTNSPYLLRYLEIPSLYFCHEPLAKIFEPHCEGNWRTGLLSTIKKSVLERIVRVDAENAVFATLICANSLYSKENIYRNYGVYPRLNYCGVDIENFRPLDLPRKNQVLCVGSLNPAKGHDFVIRSVGLIPAPDRPSVKFIYNSKYYRNNYQDVLQALATRLGVEVYFSNLVSDSDLIEAYNTSRVTACPNLLEPFGLVPIESMACSTPVVGVAEGGLRETIRDNVTGISTERDETEFSDAIRRLMTDDVVWERMSAAGRPVVENAWTWDRSYSQLEKHMRMAVAKFAQKVQSK